MTRTSGMACKIRCSKGQNFFIPANPMVDLRTEYSTVEDSAVNEKTFETETQAGQADSFVVGSELCMRRVGVLRETHRYNRGSDLTPRFGNDAIRRAQLSPVRRMIRPMLGADRHVLCAVAHSGS